MPVSRGEGATPNVNCQIVPILCAGNKERLRAKRQQPKRALMQDSRSGRTAGVGEAGPGRPRIEVDSDY
jgi:hypothetical protein